MSYSPPDPPAALAADVVDRLAALSPEQLRSVADYASALAEHRDREARLAEDEKDETEEDELDEVQEDRPEEVPSKATITIKEINDNRYYYWQWREGDSIKSKYKGPVNPDG